MNLKEQIKNAQDCKVEKVHVPEWDATIHLKQISLGERVSLWTKLEEKGHEARLTAHILLVCICDEHGKRVFTDDDYDILAAKNAKVVDRLGKQAGELNSMVSAAVDDAKKN